MRIESCHTRQTQTHTQNLPIISVVRGRSSGSLVSGLVPRLKFTWHDGRYAHAQFDRGGADACAFGRGGAESTTFDLKIDDRQWIPNGVIHVSYNAKNAQQRVSG